MEDLSYKLKSALPNKMVDGNGNVTDLFGNPVLVAEEVYDNKPALPNKWINPDGSYSTLQELLAGGIDTDIFVPVEELPEIGDPKKIYLVPDDDGGFLEYHYKNGKWDIIGAVKIDLSKYSTTEEMMNAINAACLVTLNSAKEYVDEALENIKIEPQVIYWDGNENNYEPFDKLLACKNSVLMVYSRMSGIVLQHFICVINKPAELTTGAKIQFSPTNLSSVLRSDLGYTIKGQTNITVTLTFDDSRHVTKLVKSDIISEITYIDVNHQYSAAFVPTTDRHPATKKYVDDTVRASIRDVLGGEY